MIPARGPQTRFLYNLCWRPVVCFHTQTHTHLRVRAHMCIHASCNLLTVILWHISLHMPCYILWYTPGRYHSIYLLLLLFLSLSVSLHPLIFICHFCPLFCFPSASLFSPLSLALSLSLSFSLFLAYSFLHNSRH